jgi:hypothetical protein
MKRRTPEAHELADLLPRMTDAEAAELRADIVSNGLLQPIVLYEGKVLDGRHRLGVCVQFNKPMKFVTFKGTREKAAAFVISANLRRRNLTESQRAMIADRMAQFLKGQTAAKMRRTAHLPGQPRTRAQKETAALLKVGRRTVQQARKVRRTGTKALVKAVEDGHIKVDAAVRVAELPPEEQDKIAAQPALARRVKPPPKAKLGQEDRAFNRGIEAAAELVETAHEPALAAKIRTLKVQQ